MDRRANRGVMGQPPMGDDLYTDAMEDGTDRRLTSIAEVYGKTDIVSVLTSTAQMDLAAMMERLAGGTRRFQVEMASSPTVLM